MSGSDQTALLEAARAAFARRDWPAARDGFLAARALGPLCGDDTHALGDAVWWLGGFRQAIGCYEEAFGRYMEEGREQQAAHAAFGIAAYSFMRGDAATSSGWMGRGMRLLAGLPPSVVHGYVLYMEFGGAIDGEDLDTALDRARGLQEAGRRFSDPNLSGLGILAEGRVRLRQGNMREGIALLDEAMLLALSDTMNPSWSGHIYCELMKACHELSDIQRAREWTRATARWCDSMPAAGPFMGVCRVHRSQVFQVQGHWQQAEQEAARVCAELADFDVATVAEGYYQRAEIRRLRGDLAGAEAAYQQAHQRGRDPQPGLALLRLAQGRGEAAAASLAAALAVQPHNLLARSRLLAAQVEVGLATSDVTAARGACDELQTIAAAYRTSGLEAVAAHMRGAVLVAEGQAAPAIATLRGAAMRWQQLDAPYETARVRVLLARAYEALADADAAVRELEAARTMFADLGATPDARAVMQLLAPSALPGGLSTREGEVLALVAAGSTNKEIAAALVISEKTVARHLSNIFTKLEVSTRTAAAAFAFEHGLATREHG